MTAGLERDLVRAQDRLAECDDANRVARLLDFADAFEVFADKGSARPGADRATSEVIHLIADADLVASGQLQRRHATDTALEPVIGDIIDRMAGTPDLRVRAAMVRDIVDAVDDEDVAESVAHLPYGGLVGGVDDMYWPASFPKLVRNVFRRWQVTR